MSSRPETNILIHASGLRLAYGPKTILRQVALTVRRGERWFIVGPNGHGKTTLMRAILGLTPAAEGELHRHPEMMSPAQVGFVPQRCDLNPSLPTTVREFVTLGLVGLKADHADRRRRLAEALEAVGLGDKINAGYWSLSGGQRQRCLLARALIRRPRVLMLDEPTNGLDPTAELNLMRTIVKLSEEHGLTMLFVTHAIGLAPRFGTHAALVYNGRVHAGPVSGIFQPELLKEVYGVALTPWMHAHADSPMGDAR